MRKSGRKMWLPFVAAMAGLVASPLMAQDTSEESGKSKKSEHKVEVITDGQIVISDGNGKVKVMKLKKDGENAFIWKQESGEHAGDSPKVVLKRETRVKGDGDVQEGKIRAILVGPDGKQEVELHIDGAEGEWHLGEGEAGHLLQLLPGAMQGEHNLMFHLNAQVGGFMIGVSCGEITDTLKKQLGVKSGLVVESVVEDSPADGQLQEHDILIHAGDVNLSEIGQLIEAVQAAGEAEKALDLSLVRNGKKKKVSVTPKKREMPEGLDIEALGEDGFILKMTPEMMHSNSFDFETVGPGVIEWQTGSGSELTDDLKSEIKVLRQKLEELSKKLEGKK